MRIRAGPVWLLVLAHAIGIATSYSLSDVQVHSNAVSVSADGRPSLGPAPLPSPSQSALHARYNSSQQSLIVLNAEIASGCRCVMRLQSDLSSTGPTDRDGNGSPGAVTDPAQLPATPSSPEAVLLASNVLDVRGLRPSGHAVSFECAGGRLSCSAVPRRLVLIDCGAGGCPGRQAEEGTAESAERGDHNKL